jgi:hypothetical protein
MGAGMGKWLVECPVRGEVFRAKDRALAMCAQNPAAAQKTV